MKAGDVVRGDTETAILLSPSDARKLDAEALFARAVIRTDAGAAGDLAMDKRCKTCGAEGLTWYRSHAGRPYLAGLYVVDYDEARIFSRYEIRPHFLICKGSK